MNNSKWCPLPWVGVSVRNNGDVRVCCNANTSPGRGLITKNGTTERFNLSETNIHDFRDSDYLRKLRLDMLADIPNEICLRCDKEESVGLRSRRIQDRELWGGKFELDDAVNLTSADGSIDVTKTPLLFADLRFGNKCNLKCVMCGPTDSDQWYTDHVTIWGETVFNDGGHRVNLVKKSPDSDRYITDSTIYEWYNNANFWKELSNAMPQLQHIYLVGGEPLLIEEHYSFLEECIATGNADHITMEYNSNITNIPSKCWALWEKFKSVAIGCSIDGAGPINDYIRYPSKWSRLEKNMWKLDAAPGNLKVWLSATVLVYNMVQFPDLLLWKMKQNFKRINRGNFQKHPIINAHPLHTAQIMNVKIFPKESKVKIRELYERKITEANEFIDATDYIVEKELHKQSFYKMLHGYLDYMDAGDYSHLLPDLWKYTNSLDRIRGTSLKETCPLTWELLKGDTAGLE